ncbi:hypothetical protein TrCOL_g9302 [Triparma columacea]|uniref:Uncharacterized protein n=1 Tax=Triparma columacea TaxID=722753 RepID=A0A9W7LBZ5_9STRA|nr:hypothetical protein TrCOL_g9302 [Triparma columacea]
MSPMNNFVIVVLLIPSILSYSFRTPITASSLSSVEAITGAHPPPISSTPPPPSHLSSLHSLSMKKGKPNVPPMMRSQYKQQQSMNTMREQMMDAQNVGPDGIPIFNMYVKSPTGAGMWYPCGSFKGDERTKALIESQDGILGGMAKKQLEQGVAGSLYDSITQLRESVVRSYPQLKKSRENLVWGYKITVMKGTPNEEEMKKIKEVVPEARPEGFLDNVKNMFN